MKCFACHNITPRASWLSRHPFCPSCAHSYSQDTNLLHDLLKDKAQLDPDAGLTPQSEVAYQMNNEAEILDRATRRIDRG